MTREKIQEIYKNRIEVFKLKKNAIKKKLVIVSILRFLTFIAAIAVFVLLVKSFSVFKLFFAIALLASFISFVIYYIKETGKQVHFQNLIDINSTEIKVINNDFKEFYPGKEYINREHQYSYDLDLFGEGSIFQYLNRTTTLVGRELLAKRLLEIRNVEENLIGYKQNAVKDLTSKLDWCHNFIAIGYACPVTSKDNKKIESWINTPVYFIRKAFFKIMVILLPVVTLSLLGLVIAGVSHYSWFVLSGLTQLLFASFLLRKSNREQNIVTEELRILKNYSKLIRHIEDEKFEARILNQLQSDLKTGNINAQSAFKKLIRIIDAFDTRLNIFLGVILNATLMWDLYSLMRLERWKSKYGRNIRNWIQVIAEFEYYISLANYGYNNPDFTYPVISKDKVLDTKELGHPLIPREKRISNDFCLLRPGKIEIITGANMAGKSTFLRTIGVNIVLAMNGLPVCAQEFNFRIMDLFSGMRTADSLKENESYFYAELKRLKNIIETLKENSKPTLILLDEILKGTNSIDKAKGSWKFVENLIQLKATGIVATHDLSLCELGKKYPQNIENKCFEVEIYNDQIKFDYKLRPGVTKNMNASLLMKQMGIFSN